MSSLGDPQFSAEVEEVDGVTVVRIAGELDVASSDHLTEILDGLAERKQDGILVDATGLTFVDSTGLQALLRSRQTIREQGKDLAIVPSPQLSRLLEVTEMTEVFSVFETVEDAAAAIAADRRA